MLQILDPYSFVPLLWRADAKNLLQELRLADYQRGWGKKVQGAPSSVAEKEVPGAFPSSPEKGGKGSEDGAK